MEATADTRYFTGSTTKAFTAAAVAHLVQDQDQYPDLKWTSPINEYIREDFVLEDEHATTHTTIEDALSHRSGLPRHDLMYGLPGDTTSSIVKRMRYLPRTAEPRTKYQYCNLMYGVITDLLETVTGSKLEVFLHDHFWKPLGMVSTSFSLTSQQSGSDPQVARGYYWDSSSGGSNSTSQKGHYISEPYLDLLPVSGAGAIISTVNDYALWIKALLDAANTSKTVNSSSPITSEIFRAIVTPRVIAADLASDEEAGFVTPPLYALGWVNSKVLGETVISHDGGVTGFGANVNMLPNKRFGIVSMGNTAGTSNSVGLIVATRLLTKKIGLSSGDKEFYTSVRNTLTAASEITLTHQVTGVQSKVDKVVDSRGASPLQSTKLPLPGKLADFVGTYAHPGYGTINFTIANAKSLHSESSEVLRGYFSPRTWPRKIELVHITDTVFEAKAFSPHGIGNIDSHSDTNEVLWEYSEPSRQAVFKFGLDGETVETMGIEIEPQMVETARGLGPKHWKEGMIWFEKE